MTSYTIFHNPRCQNSRGSLDILQNHGIEPEIRDYLSNPPTVAELQHLERLLDRPLSTFVRTKEPLYKELNPKEENLHEIVSKHPILLERPIVIRDDKEAIVSRPPETLLPFLEQEN